MASYCDSEHVGVLTHSRLSADDVPKKRVASIFRPASPDVLAYLDFSVSTTGILAGVKVGCLTPGLAEEWMDRPSQASWPSKPDIGWTRNDVCPVASLSRGCVTVYCLVNLLLCLRDAQESQNHTC